jgi:argininosuccinate lyase
MGGQKSSPKEMKAVLGIGGRLDEKPSKELVRSAFSEELIAQSGLFSGMDLADLAYGVVLAESGVVAEKEAAELLAALLELRTEGDALVLDPVLGDLYTNRENWLAERTSAVGWLGAGRARRESTTTAYHIVLRRELLGLSASLCSLASALADGAKTHRDSLMPDYTYLQAAQPTTFGHYLLSFAFPVLRDLERIKALYVHINKSPAGCGSANGSTLVKDRARLAELMGFDGLVDHARDAMWQADLPIEALSMVVASLVNMDRLAEDLMVFSTAEFGVVSLSDAHARSSKIMPQKKNPFALSYIRALANQAIGVQASLAAAGRTPSGQMDNRLFAYEDTPKMIALSADAADLMTAVVTGLSFDNNRVEGMFDENFSIASDLAETVMREAGLDYRTAHRLVGRLSRDGLAERKKVSEITLEDLDRAAQEVIGKPLGLSSKALAYGLDPYQAVANRNGQGGAAPAPVDAMIENVRDRLSDYSTWGRTLSKHDDAAEQDLLKRAAEIAGKA